MNPNIVQRRTVGTHEEITIAPVTSEKGAGETRVSFVSVLR
jgi:hypothetical protein